MTSNHIVGDGRRPERVAHASRTGRLLGLPRRATGRPQTIGANVVAFGKFDGVHLGHRALLARSAQTAYRLGLPYGVATFERHPYSHLRPGSSPPVLTGVAQKLRLFREAGARFVVLLAADPTVLGVRPSSSPAQSCRNR